MANPQKENGYTPIANELIEMIYLGTFNATQLRIILLITRYTYGFSRKSHELSLSFIHGALGGNKRNLQRELQKLIDGNVILVMSEASFNKARELSLNKDHEKWDNCFSQQAVNDATDGDIAVTADTTGDGENATTTDGVHATTTDGEKAAQDKQYIKQNIKQDGQTLFEQLWKMYPEKKGKAKVSAKTKEKLYELGYDTVKTCIDRYIADKPDWKQYQHGGTFFTSGYIDYLDENYINHSPPVRSGYINLADIVKRG